MKKSTLLFISGNLLILLIPMLFMLGLRFKINRGDIIDLQALSEARTKKESFETVENIELNSKYGIVSLDIFMDTLNLVVMDTSDYKYIKYRIRNNTLIVDYDFLKDSLENEEFAESIIKKRTQEEGKRVGEENDLGVSRNISVYVKSKIKSISVKNGTVSLNLSIKNRVSNNLDIMAYNGVFSVYNPLRDEESASIQEMTSLDSIPFKIKAKLNYSGFDIGLSYVKELELEARESNLGNFNLDFEHLNLKIDDSTSMSVDVSKLRKMNIQYLK